MMLMGSKNIICVMFYVSLSPLFIRWTLAVGNSHDDPHSLDDFVHNYAQKRVKLPHTGTLYNISLPSNYSGIGVSFVRLRSASFWARGTNISSSFHIPPRIIPMPFVKRLDIVFQNLGNWSTFYYNVPNYTFVAPIIGLTIYSGDTNSSVNHSQMLNVSLHGNPILVNFLSISIKDSDNATLQCVRFDKNGTVEFSNVTTRNLCTFRDQGHFSIVVPLLQPPIVIRKREEKWNWKWWVVVFGTAVGGSGVLVLVGILVWKLVRMKRIKGMEKQAEKSEALGTVWVGRSRMPSASGIRTQPVLEDDYIP